MTPMEMGSLRDGSVDEQPPKARRAARLERAEASGGIQESECLTSGTVIMLVGLLAAEGYTIVNVGGLVRAHIFIGMVLIPPVLLKLVSTGYRFVRGRARREALPRAGFGGMLVAAALGGGAALALALVLSFSTWHG
jgi:hypothetical protein